MAFYKLFKRRTNYNSMLETVDRMFRKEKWDEYDRQLAEAYKKLYGPITAIRRMLPDGYFN